MKYPIKVLKDKDQNPFIPFVTTSSVVENGTNRNLDDILHNLTVPIANLNSLENTTVADMMTNMKDYKDSGFAIIYVNTDNTGLLLAFEKITTVDALNKCWSFVSSFNADSKAYRINITGYYNADSSVFTVSSATIEELKQKSSSNIYELPVSYASTNYINLIPKQEVSDVINKIKQDGIVNPVIRLVVQNRHQNINEQVYYDYIYTADDGPATKERSYYTFVCYGRTLVSGAPARAENMTLSFTYIQINGKWTDDVFTCTWIGGADPYKVKLDKIALTDNVLTKNNVTKFTPTEPYHPSTKQYVDDSINKIPITQDLVDNGFDYDTGTTGSIEVTANVINISTTYGFALNANGYYESNNNKKANSWALCKVTINAPQAFTLTIPYISSGENNYDYGIFGQLDTELANSVTDDGATGSAKVKLNCKSQASTDVKQVSYDIPAGEHFIEIKYRKDSSGDQGNDSLQFKIDATFSVEGEVFVNKKLATTDMLDTLPMIDTYVITTRIVGDIYIDDADTLTTISNLINTHLGKLFILILKSSPSTGANTVVYVPMYWTKPYSTATNTSIKRNGILLAAELDANNCLNVMPIAFKANTVYEESYTITQISVNSSSPTEQILTKNSFKKISGYNSSKTQVLKNVNGTLKWVTEESA